MRVSRIGLHARPIQSGRAAIAALNNELWGYPHSSSQRILIGWKPEAEAGNLRLLLSSKGVDRAPDQTGIEASKAEPAKPVAEKNAETPKVEKPKRKRMSTEARVLYELNRHGIYR